MSNKITDARVKDLQSLNDKVEQLKKHIEQEEQDLQKLYDAMGPDERYYASSSSNAVRRARRKQASTLDHKAVIEGHQLAKQRLEEQFAKANKELQELKQLMGKP